MCQPLENRRKERNGLFNDALNTFHLTGGRCSFVIMCSHGVMGRQIDPSWLTH